MSCQAHARYRAICQSVQHRLDPRGRAPSSGDRNRRRRRRCLGAFRRPGSTSSARPDVSSSSITSTEEGTARAGRAQERLHSVVRPTTSSVLPSSSHAKSSPRRSRSAGRPRPAAPRRSSFDEPVLACGQEIPVAPAGDHVRLALRPRQCQRIGEMHRTSHRRRRSVREAPRPLGRARVRTAGDPRQACIVASAGLARIRSSVALRLSTAARCRSSARTRRCMPSPGADRPSCGRVPVSPRQAPAEHSPASRTAPIRPEPRLRGRVWRIRQGGQPSGVRGRAARRIASASTSRPEPASSRRIAASGRSRVAGGAAELLLPTESAQQVGEAATASASPAAQASSYGLGLRPPPRGADPPRGTSSCRAAAERQSVSTSLVCPASHRPRRPARTHPRPRRRRPSSGPADVCFHPAARDPAAVGTRTAHRLRTPAAGGLSLQSGLHGAAAAPRSAQAHSFSRLFRGSIRTPRPRNATSLEDARETSTAMRYCSAHARRRGCSASTKRLCSMSRRPRCAQPTARRSARPPVRDLASRRPVLAIGRRGRREPEPASQPLRDPLQRPTPRRPPRNVSRRSNWRALRTPERRYVAGQPVRRPPRRLGAALGNLPRYVHDLVAGVATRPHSRFGLAEGARRPGPSRRVSRRG